MPSHDVSIQVKYPMGARDEPFVSMLEANLERPQVAIERHPAEVKSLFVSFVVVTTEKFLFAKLVLEPLASPLINRWKAALKNYGSTPHFECVVQVNGEEWIEIQLGTDARLIGDVWRILKKATDILKHEKLLERTSRIRFTQGKNGQEFVICYEQNRPARMVLINENKTVEISQAQIKELRKPISPIEDIG